jgi:uncharacterized Rmd1/YagE family protein
MVELEILAYNLASEIVVSDFYFEENGHRKKFNWMEPSIIEYTKSSFCFIYNFGTVVFFNVSEIKRLGMLNKLSGFLINPRFKRTVETFDLEIKPGFKVEVGFNKIILPRLDSSYLKLISFVVAQSVSLKSIEMQVDKVLDSLYYIIDRFWKKGKVKWNNRKILKLIAYGIKLRHSILSELLLVDKPSETWEFKKLNNFYDNLTDMFELKRRYKTLDRKLEILLENTQIITDLSISRKEILLEWMIVGLFIFDVILVFIDIFAKV